MHEKYQKSVLRGTFSYFFRIFSPFCERKIPKTCFERDVQFLLWKNFIILCTENIKNPFWGGRSVFKIFSSLLRTENIKHPCWGGQLFSEIFYERSTLKLMLLLPLLLDIAGWPKTHNKKKTEIVNAEKSGRKAIQLLTHVVAMIFSIPQHLQRSNGHGVSLDIGAMGEPCHAMPYPAMRWHAMPRGQSDGGFSNRGTASKLVQFHLCILRFATDLLLKSSSPGFFQAIENIETLTSEFSFSTLFS